MVTRSRTPLYLTAVLVAGALLALPATASAGSPPVTKVASGSTHTCALINDGTVRCWGSGGSGELGNGQKANQTTPVDVTGIDNAIDIAAAGSYTCAVLATGSIKCWGALANKSCTASGGGGGGGGFGFPGGGLIGGGGGGDDCTRSTPEAVSGIANATQVATGNQHVCARLSDGTAKCWGQATYGSLGDSLTVNGTSTTPKTVQSTSGFPGTALTNVAEVAVGAAHSCARLVNGTVRCWGWNTQGQLGTGNTTDLYQATTAATGISGATELAADRNGNSTCAVVTSGKVKCWGNNGLAVGLLGTGSTADTISTPAFVKDSSGNDLSGIQSLDMYGSICAVKSTGSLFCWGINGTTGTTGRLETGSAVTFKTATGFSTYTYLDAATEVTTATGVTSVALGQFYVTNCAAADNGATVRCWPNTSGDRMQAVAGLLGSTPPPATPVLSGAPSGTVNSNSASVSFSSTGATSYTCSVDGGAYSACTSPKSLTGLTDGSHSLAVKGVNSAGESTAATASWTVRMTAGPIASPSILTPPTGVKTVYRRNVNGLSTWTMKLGLLFSTGGDTRGAAQFLTVQVAVDSKGVPVSSRPSDSQPRPTAPTFNQGVVPWNPSGEVSRATALAPVWVRVGNRVGKWTGWVQLKR